MDWREEIKSHINEFSKMKEEVNKALSMLLSDMSVSPYAYHARAEESQDRPLTWDIRIGIPNVGKLNFDITFDEIKQLNNKYDEFGQPIHELPEELSEALKPLLVRKIKEQLPI